VKLSCYIFPWGEPARVRREISSVSTHGDFLQYSEIACVLVIYKQAKNLGSHLPKFSALSFRSGC